MEITTAQHIQNKPEALPITLDLFKAQNQNRADQDVQRSFRGLVRFVLTHSGQTHAQILEDTETGGTTVVADPAQLIHDIQHIREGYGQAAHIPQYLQTLHDLSQPDHEPPQTKGVGLSDFQLHWGSGAPLLFRNFLKRVERGDFPELRIKESGLSYQAHIVEGDILEAYRKLQDLHGTKKYPSPLLRVLKEIAESKINQNS